MKATAIFPTAAASQNGGALGPSHQINPSWPKQKSPPAEGQEKQAVLLSTVQTALQLAGGILCELRTGNTKWSVCPTLQEEELLYCEGVNQHSKKLQISRSV